MKKLLVFMSILMVLCFTLAGCSTIDNIFNREEETVATQAVTEATEVPTETETVFEYSTDPDDYVEVAREEEYGDGDVYIIPRITIDSKGADTVNADISGIYDPIFDVRGEVDSSYSCTGISYEAYVSNEMLSVTVTAEYNGNTDYNSAYTLDLRDGSLMNNRDIMLKLGLDFEEVAKRVLDAAQAKYKEKFEEDYEDDVDYEDCLEKTLDADNLKESKLYINDEGDLKALIPMCYVTDLRIHHIFVTL